MRSLPHDESLPNFTPVPRIQISFKMAAKTATSVPQSDAEVECDEAKIIASLARLQEMHIQVSSPANPSLCWRILTPTTGIVASRTSRQRCADC